MTKQLPEQQALQEKADSLTVFLSYMCNIEDSQEQQAKKIRKCAKVIGKRTKSSDFKKALRAIRNEKLDSQVIKALHLAVNNYLFQRAIR